MVVVYLGDYIRMIVPINLFLLWLVGVGALLAAETVSYTHLDVYKRQIHNIAFPDIFIQ